ncbi:MAG: DUF2796 domain-containing protein [Nitrosospira sp.]
MKQALRSPRRALVFATMAFELALPAWAHEPATHVHGAGSLEIAIDGAAVQINLYSPLDNLLGFEHAPGNEKERQAAKFMALRLHQADNLFILTPQAQCRLETTRLESPVLAPNLLMPAPDSGKTADKSNGRKDNTSKPALPALNDMHGELEATWQFQCALPQALQSLDVRLFQAFPGLRRLDAAVAGPKGQFSAKLLPKSTRLKW